MNPKPPVQYVLVRADLPIVIQLVQVGHACGEAIQVAPISRETHIRLLHVADEAELRAHSSKLAAKGFHHALVCEPDAPYNGQAMALATEPSIERISALGKLFYHLLPASFLSDREALERAERAKKELAWIEECINANPTRRCLSFHHTLHSGRKFYCDFECAEMDGACSK